MKQLALAAGLAMVLVAIGFIARALLLDDAVDERGESVRRPMPGEIRPDYLSDGTPVWAVGHEDGSVSVLLGFDAHLPYNLGKILWWCPTARAFDNPEHGSKYDEYGVRIGGPAPGGLRSYETRLAGSRVVVGELLPAPGMDARHTGPHESERDWCTFPREDVVYHTFDGWRAWESPTEAVEAAGNGWILLVGSLSVLDGDVFLCASTGCHDAVPATNVETPTERIGPGSPLFGERFIARVRDGALTGVTRVMPLPPP